MSIKEKLTKGEAIRRHRLMWNYIADESARTRTRINKVDALYHFGWEKCLLTYAGVANTQIRIIIPCVIIVHWILQKEMQMV